MSEDQDKEGVALAENSSVPDIPNDFSMWNSMKQILNDSTDPRPTCNEREIWWCALGKNIGSEDNGKNDQFERPVLIFRKFGEDTSWIIPISSQPCRKDSRFLYQVLVQEVIRTARLHQLRLISNKRLLRYIDRISMEDFTKIRRMIADLA